MHFSAARVVMSWSVDPPNAVLLAVGIWPVQSSAELSDRYSIPGSAYCRHPIWNRIEDRCDIVAGASLGSVCSLSVGFEGGTATENTRGAPTDRFCQPIRNRILVRIVGSAHDWSSCAASS